MKETETQKMAGWTRNYLPEVPEQKREKISQEAKRAGEVRRRIEEILEAKSREWGDY